MGPRPPVLPAPALRSAATIKTFFRNLIVVHDLAVLHPQHHGDRNSEAAARLDKPLLDVLRKSPYLLLDESQLEDVIERVEFVDDAKDLKLSPREKARVILAIYREEKTSGHKVDFARMEQLIKRER